MKRAFFYVFYYFLARHLPISYKPYSFCSKGIRYWACKHLFKTCGKNVNVEHGAEIGSGQDVEIGDNSGIGINCVVKKAKIGKNVLMAPEVVFIVNNHRYDQLDIPIAEQGYREYPPITIGDNTWIGTRAIILPGIEIGANCIVAAGSVVTRNIPDNHIVGGNPARTLKTRV